MRIVLALSLLAMTALADSDKCSTSTGAEEATEKLEIKTVVPAHLKGGTIIVRRADGAESVVSAEQFKVVPRKQQFIVTHTERKSITTCKGAEELRNRLSILGGKAPTGRLSTTATPGVVTVEQEGALVTGAQYQRKIGNLFSIEINICIFKVDKFAKFRRCEGSKIGRAHV